MLLVAPALAQQDIEEPSVEEAVPSTVVENGDAAPSNSDTSTQKEPEPTQEPSPEIAPSINSPVDPPTADIKTKKSDHYPNCEFDNVQECDLAAQQGMAESTSWMNRAAWVGLFLTVIALVFLWHTMRHTKDAATYAKGMLIEAKETTKAAVKAATEARRQADIAELSMTRLERPYLFPEIVQTSYLQDSGPNKPFLRYRFINQGRTPAILQSVSIRLAPAPKLPLRLPLGVKIDVYEVIAPGAFTTEKIIRVEGCRVGDFWRGVEATKLIFHGSIRYQDATGWQHTDGFCLRANENAEGFVMDGGEAYNYRTSVGPSSAIERPEE